MPYGLGVVSGLVYSSSLLAPRLLYIRGRENGGGRICTGVSKPPLLYFFLIPNVNLPKDHVADILLYIRGSLRCLGDMWGCYVLRRGIGAV